MDELNADLPSLGEELWREEQKRLLGFKKTFALLNDLPATYKSHYVVIKAYNTLPHIPHDVDIFVPLEKKNEIIKEFEKKIGIKIEKINVGRQQGKALRAELLVLLKDEAGLTYAKIIQYPLFQPLKYSSLGQLYKRTKARMR